MEPRNGKALSTFPVGGERGRAGAGAPAEVMEVGTDLRSEITALRREFAGSMAALRGTLAESDGDLHEMQLASLRRQISQLEGVLESNYQRELRSAEERESALRAEMAQMRQDLRVALETLYRMPGESPPATPAEDHSDLQERLEELRSTLLSASNEREQAALERESTLKTELAHMRRDLLVTLEASYQLPGDRTDALDAQLVAWRGEVEELQRLILAAHQRQEEAAAGQLAALGAQFDALGSRLESTIAASSPDALQDELAAQQALLAQLNDRLGEQAAGELEREERVAETLAAATAVLEERLAELRADLGSTAEAVTGLAAQQGLLAQVKDRLGDLISQQQEEDERLSETLAAGTTALEQRLAELGSELRSTAEAVAELTGQQELLGRLENRVGEQVATEREHAERIAQTVTEGRSALEERLGALSAELSSALESWSAREETPPGEAQHAAFESVLGRISELRTALEESQAETARQLGARDDLIAGLGADLSSLSHAFDESRTEQRTGLDTHLSALREQLAATRQDLLESVTARLDTPAEASPLTADDVGVAVRELLAASESRALAAQEVEYRHLASQLGELQGDFDLLRTEIQALQPLESEPPAAQSEGLTELRAFLAELRSDPPATRGEELTELRALLDELRSSRIAVEPASPGAATAGAGAASSFDPAEIESALADVRAAVARLAPSNDSELGAQIEQLRADLLASVETLRPVPAPQPLEQVGENELSARLEQLELAILHQAEEQRAWLAERERTTAGQLEQLRAALQEVPAAAPIPASDDEWRREILELRSEIAALAGRMEPAGETPTVNVVEALRDEIRAALSELSPPQPVEGGPSPDAGDLRGELTQLSAVLSETRAEQARIVEAQQSLLQTALDGMRADLKTALEAVNRENLDSFEKRQAQLRLDQIEMERSLSKLRQELVTNKSDPGKKKLWH